MLARWIAGCRWAVKGVGVLYLGPGAPERLYNGASRLQPSSVHMIF
jgi:hypothetical protein